MNMSCSFNPEDGTATLATALQETFLTLQQSHMQMIK